MMKVNNEEFMRLLAQHVPPDQRILYTSVPGDPEDAGQELWNVKPWRVGGLLPNPKANNYVCVSSFIDGKDGFRRRAEQFGSGLAFMIDDLGTKLDLKIVERCRPTALVCTSPNNYQAWYFLSKPVTTYDHFGAVQEAFVNRWAAGKDPGMRGANRIGRLPEGINGKNKYRNDDGRFKCFAVEWFPDALYTTTELAEAFDMFIVPASARGKYKYLPKAIPADEMKARQDEFDQLVRHMEKLDMFTKRAFGNNGRRPMLCPWVADHTGQATTGTYLSEPSEKNEGWGSFVCFHSTTHNDNCHLRDLKRYVDDQIEPLMAEYLEQVNQRERWKPS